jgi:hypothetical protein
LKRAFRDRAEAAFRDRAEAAFRDRAEAAFPLLNRMTRSVAGLVRGRFGQELVWEYDVDHGTHARTALHLQAGAVSLGQALCQGQTQAGALVLARHGVSDHAERFQRDFHFV